MELKDTVAMMDNDDYKERFKAEYYQLKIRIGKLANMLVKYKNHTLDFEPICSYELLTEQLIYMQDYLEVLEERATRENMPLFLDEVKV